MGWSVGGEEGGEGLQVVSPGDPGLPEVEEGVEEPTGAVVTVTDRLTTFSSSTGEL